MGVIFYNLFLLLFRAGIHLAALFHPKARKWVKGRRNIFERLQQEVEGKGPVVWMHCASLGEFEQGRPLLEAIRSEYPAYRILLTFFSPSGYEVRKNYTGADWVFYLPMDGASSARRFLSIVQPSLVIFVKYEFWYYYLKKIKYRNIPLLLVSALFMEKMSFFRWYGAMPRKMLSRFNQLFVQDQASLALMQRIGLHSITQVSGDTRFDRVVSVAMQASGNSVLESATPGKKVLVAGSTWPEDEQLLKEAVSQMPQGELMLVIAPHEIHESHLRSIEEKFPGIVRYSALRDGNASVEHHQHILIDNIGLLSQLYKYGWAAFIGGGFGKGIHNTLEAAVYGIPIFFGPVHQKFREAKELQEKGGAFCVQNAVQLVQLLDQLQKDAGQYEASAEASRNYVYERVGATAMILHYIQEKRLLTK